MDCSLLDSCLAWDFPAENTVVSCQFLLQGSSRLRDWIYASCWAGGFFIIESTGKPKYGISWSFLEIVFIQLRKFSIHSLLRVSLLSSYWIFSNALCVCVLIDIIMRFLIFRLLMWWITLINFQILNETCIPGINST